MNVTSDYFEVAMKNTRIFVLKLNRVNPIKGDPPYVQPVQGTVSTPRMLLGSYTKSATVTLHYYVPFITLVTFVGK